MKKPFAVGDRVRCYPHGAIAYDTKPLKGEIITLSIPPLDSNGSGAAEVQFEFSPDTSWFHVKCLRRLTKKPQQRIWLDLRLMRDSNAGPTRGFNLNFMYSSGTVSTEPQPGWTEFREVKRGGGK